MKKVLKNFDHAMYEIIGDEAFKDRPAGFRYTVEIILLVVTGFITVNLIQLFL